MVKSPIVRLSVSVYTGVENVLVKSRSAKGGVVTSSGSKHYRATEIAEKICAMIINCLLDLNNAQNCIILCRKFLKCVSILIIIRLCIISNFHAIVSSALPQVVFKAHVSASFTRFEYFFHS